MFTHAFLGTNDVEASRKFYNAVMKEIGFDHAVELPDRTIYPGGAGAFIVAKPLNGEAATVSNGHTLGFHADSYAAVDAWHAAGVANGGTCEGAPGFRESSPGNQYGAYLRDPDGNKICAYTANVGPKA